MPVQHYVYYQMTTHMPETYLNFGHDLHPHYTIGARVIYNNSMQNVDFRAEVAPNGLTCHILCYSFICRSPMLAMWLLEFAPNRHNSTINIIISQRSRRYFFPFRPVSRGCASRRLVWLAIATCITHIQIHISICSCVKWVKCTLHLSPTFVHVFL